MRVSNHAGIRVKETRIIFAALPSMLRDIIGNAVGTQPDLHVVEQMDKLESLPEVIQRTRPDIIVVSADQSALPPACASAMYDKPHPRTLCISPDGRRTTLYRLLPHGVVMEDASTDAILDAIRELSLPYPGVTT